MMDKGLIGLIIGLVLGYICGLLQNNGRALREEHRDASTSMGRGLTRFKLLNRFGSSQIGLFLVLALTVYASIMAGVSSNKVEDQQDRNDRQLACTSQILDATVDALSSRTVFSVPQSQASADLQAAQEKFFASINPSSPTIVTDYKQAYAEYQVAYNKYVDISAKTKSQIVSNSYPSPDELNKCVNS